MAQQNKEATLGFSSTPPSTELLSSLPGSQGWGYAMAAVPSVWTVLLSVLPLMPFTLHLDIFQVHFDNNAQVKVMGKKLNLREPNIQPSREPNLKPFAAMSTSRDVREKKREGEWGLGRPCPQTWRGSSQDDCYCMALTVNPGDPASRAEMCLPWYWGIWKD